MGGVEPSCFAQGRQDFGRDRQPGNLLLHGLDFHEGGSGGWADRVDRVKRFRHVIGSPPCRYYAVNLPINPVISYLWRNRVQAITSGGNLRAGKAVRVPLEQVAC